MFWLPSLVTSSVVVIITVSSVIISMRIQLAKLETKFDAKFESIDAKFISVEKDINRLERDIGRIESKIDNLNNHFIDHLKDHPTWANKNV